MTLYQAKQILEKRQAHLIKRVEASVKDLSYDRAEAEALDVALCLIADKMVQESVVLNRVV